MKVLVGMLLAGACAWSVAGDPTPVSTEPATATDQTDLIERFRYIETLDITAEKPAAPANAVEPVSDEIDDILAESDLAEQ